MLIFSSAGALSGAGPNEPACSGETPEGHCSYSSVRFGNLNMLSLTIKHRNLPSVYDNLVDRDNFAGLTGIGSFNVIHGNAV